MPLPLGYATQNLTAPADFHDFHNGQTVITVHCHNDKFAPALFTAGPDKELPNIFTSVWWVKFSYLAGEMTRSNHCQWTTMIFAAWVEWSLSFSLEQSRSSSSEGNGQIMTSCNISMLNSRAVTTSFKLVMISFIPTERHDLTVTKSTQFSF